MEDFRKYLVISLPATVVVGFLIFTVYWLCIRENLAKSRIIREINTEVIKGNQFAVMIKKELYLIGWEDECLIMAALKGNESALKALRIKPDITLSTPTK